MSKLNVFAQVGYTGYGVVGFNVLKHLVKDYEVSLFPPAGGKLTLDDAEDKVWLETAIKNQEKFQQDAPFLKIWHQHDLALRVGCGPYTAWPIFELNRFSPKELRHIGCADNLIVCSHWAKSVLEAAGFTAHVVPLGVDTKTFDRKRALKPGMKHERPTCVFLNVGKWEKRKGHDVLIKAFEKAFNHQDDVALWLAPHNPFLRKEQTQEWLGRYICKISSKIRIFDRLEKQSDVADLMNVATCGIFPTRAEGWNLEALEMMSMGKPVITTFYSGHTEYVNKENTKIIEIDKLESANDGIWFNDEGEWASIGNNQIDQMVHHMRTIYDQFHTTGVPLNQAGIDTGARFSWENSVSVLKSLTFLDDMVR